MPNLKDKNYYRGFWNIMIRYYFYMMRGVALLNEFRYLVMAIIAVYAILKLDNFWLMPIMFTVSIPVLMFLGWLSVHHINKVIEFLNVEHATHWSRYQFKLLEDIRDLLKEIKEKKRQ